jgi:polysaccharide pyruvyl transferase WcaK-like protein
MGLPLNFGRKDAVADIGKYAVVGCSINSVLSETANKFVDTATTHTVARSIRPERIARQMTNCGGSEVYLASSELADLALPHRSSSKGFKRQRRQFNMTHIGSKKVATMVGR